MPPTKRRRIEPADHGVTNQQFTSQAEGSTAGFYNGFPDHMAHAIPLSAFELPQDRQGSDMMGTLWATDLDALGQMPAVIDPYFLGTAQNAQFEDQVTHLQDQPAHLQGQSALARISTALGQDQTALDEDQTALDQDQAAPVFGQGETALQMWAHDIRLPVFPEELEARSIKGKGKGKGGGKGKGKGKDRAKAPPRKRATKAVRARARASPPADDEAPEEDDEALPADDEVPPEDDEAPLVRRRRRPKNAKIHIPPDRNLDNLDDLIEVEEREGSRAEASLMKRQRRLLKNREAALKSRQKSKELLDALRAYKKECQETFVKLKLVTDTAVAELKEALQRVNEAERVQRELRSTLAMYQATAQLGAAPSRREIEGSSSSFTGAGPLQLSIFNNSGASSELMTESLFESAMQPDGHEALALQSYVAPPAADQLAAAAPTAAQAAAHDTTIDARAILHFFVHCGALVASGNSGVVPANLPAGVVAMAHAVTERMAHNSGTVQAGFVEDTFDPLLNPVTEDLGARMGFDAADVWATMPPAESVRAALDEFPVFLPEPAEGPADAGARPFGTIEPRGTKRRRNADEEDLE